MIFHRNGKSQVFSELLETKLLVILTSSFIFSFPKQNVGERGVSVETLKTNNV